MLGDDVSHGRTSRIDRRRVAPRALFVYTEEQAITDGEIIEMDDGWGVPTFRGEPVRTVSKALHGALREAILPAAWPARLVDWD
jgi:hypothetical protein